MVDTLVLGTSANAWEFESLHGHFKKSVFYNLQEFIQMLSPITSYNTNNTPKINFMGLNSNLRKLSPLNSYMNKVFDRFTYISKNRWLPVDNTIKPYLKTGEILSGKQRIPYWEINPDNSKKYIIFYHGLGQNISTNQEMYKKIIDKGYGVLAPEYISFNKTGLSNKQIKNKTKSVIDYLNQKGITAENTGVIGFSMGSFPAIETASKNKDLKFLILISPFNSLKNEVETLTLRSTVKLPDWIKYGIKKFPFILKHLDSIFKTKTKIQKIKSPVYLIQSANDQIVPLKSSRELVKKVCNLKEFIVLEKGGHNIEKNKLNAFDNLSEI